MQKVFMTAKEVQDFLEVSRTTAYQLINEMNQELMNLGYRVQRGKVNRQYFMEKYCYEKELRREG
ncbi:DNA-binding protein [Leptotrichia trevisanii]|uniref:DNA-binding protein n=1 Tax=Leptotrichia trevisanii TaxID=109328 RepID=UPI0026E961B0|nr:DNA-binding protein [Leptotrichia trevisanii]